MKKSLSFIIMLMLALAGWAQTWHQDTLGGRFESRYFDQGKDYSGPVRSTIIRLLPDGPTSKAVLYIHGFNDYFFQTEMAQQFVDHGYAFYAVDLRKYGRSLLPGQMHCQVRNFNEYFPDIDSALMVMRDAGYSTIDLMGHSTGGLIAAYYMAHKPNAPIQALILNSPFLDWNLGKMERMVGAASGIGRLFPGKKISSGSGRAYGESLNKNFHGEWTYDTIWKSISPIKVDLGWVRAVNSAQKYLKSHKNCIDKPILLMYSDKSVESDKWTPEVDRSDAVLDVKDIRKYGSQLGHEVTLYEVMGGRHDLVLSQKDVREPLYNFIFQWLASH